MFEEYTALLITFLPNMLVAVVIFVVVYFVSKIVSATILKIGKTGRLGRSNIYYLLAKVVKISVIILGLLISLGTVGIDITPLIAGIGLSGLALGLALKDSLTNLLTGILILIYKPFEEGDIIKIGGSKGTVGEINLRYIQLIDEENNREFLVPNSLAFAKEIEKVLSDDKS